MTAFLPKNLFVHFADISPHAPPRSKPLTIDMTFTDYCHSPNASMKSWRSRQRFVLHQSVGLGLLGHVGGSSHSPMTVQSPMVGRGLRGSVDGP